MAPSTQPRACDGDTAAYGLTHQDRRREPKRKKHTERERERERERRIADGC